MGSNSVKGQSVIVTGSASGLGKAIAQAFLESGANVTICDINQERIDATTKEWEAHAAAVHAVKVDVTDEVSVENLVKSAVARFGKLDILVNNAGVMDLFDPIHSCSKQMWDKALAVNLTGPFLVSKAAINAFLAKETPSGLIFNIGSNASWRGGSSGVAYTTSKHGVLALTRSTAFFYADKGIYSVTFMLGGIENTNITDMLKSGIGQMNMEAFGKVQAGQPVFEPGKTGIEVENVAKYCVFLSDRDMAASANGSCIVFNKNWPPA